MGRIGPPRAMQYPHESRVQTILTAQETRRRKACRRDSVTVRQAGALERGTHGILKMVKAELCETKAHECDDSAASLPALLVLGQQVLQFEDGIRIAAARTILPDCQNREWSDRGASLGIDGYARQIA